LGAELEARRKNINKILYRSRQRGLLELDLLIGRWATDNVPKMDAREIEHYTQILEEENPDLWKWLTEQADAPADMKANPVFASLCDHVRKELEAKADPATRTEPGRDWVRGWNDGDRKIGGPPAGNQ
jgi:succinate dehydrogenase flavin-adding protein (antitoxin of CptAB toxin-antitoxin module)